MAKNRAGLHKEIASIFDGVPILKDNGTGQSFGAAAADQAGHIPPTPPAPEPQNIPTPKPNQPAPSPAKTTRPKPEADADTKTARADYRGKTKDPGLLSGPWSLKSGAWRSWEQIKNKLFTPKLGVSATRQKATVILIPVLFIVLIFVFIQVLATPSQQAAASASFEPSNAPAASDSIDWEIPAQYPTTLRDPMRISSATTGQLETGRPVVKGIVYSQDNAAAIIGTQVMREGEKVSGATIVKINRDSVEFEMNGKRWTQKVQR